MQNQKNQNIASKPEDREIYTSIIDLRKQEEVIQQSQEAEEICERNMKLFNIELTKKKKISYQPSKLFKVQFSNNWYVNITDNGAKSNDVFLTLHGAPGDHRQWAGLQKQMQGYCRWINVVIPGFDNQDQRRGNYSGSVEDLSQLLLMLLKERNVAKIFLVGHSLGSIFASYFINHHSEYVKGYVNITGIINMWYVGLMTFYRTLAVQYKFSVGPNKNALMRLLNKNEYRQKLNKRFLDDSKDVAFGPVPFPRLTITEMAAYIKLIVSTKKGCSQFYELNKKLTLLRVLIYGKKDPLHEHYKTHQAIYSITRGYLSYHKYPMNNKLIQVMKKELEQTILETFDVKIEAQKIQEYFCYHLVDTGHNAHKRRPIELSKILRMYIVTMNIVEKYKQLISSKL